MTVLSDQESLRDTGAPWVFAETLPASGVLRPDMGKASARKVTLNQNAIIGQPFNAPAPFSRVLLQLVQDTTGGWSVTWAACWRNPPTLTTGAGVANATALMEFMYDGQSYQFLGGSADFAVSKQSIYPVTGAVTVAGVAPRTHTDPAPTPGAVTLAGVAPVISKPTVTAIAPGAGSLAATGVAPLIPNRSIQPGTGGVTIIGEEPTRTP